MTKKVFETYYIIYVVMRYLNFLLTSGFKWIDAKKFDLSKYTSNNVQKNVF